MFSKSVCSINVVFLKVEIALNATRQKKKKQKVIANKTFFHSGGNKCKEKCIILSLISQSQDCSYMRFLLLLSFIMNVSASHLLSKQQKKKRGKTNYIIAREENILY
eukprot:GEMP01055230.1.p1 GENE.GEMP01055230.1~~GEMP01055230.1.p1  ORF type:complete len:107 (-),score=0.23 GEMP01055230.1:451-771(-)